MQHLLGGASGCKTPDIQPVDSRHPHSRRRASRECRFSSPHGESAPRLERSERGSGRVGTKAHVSPERPHASKTNPNRSSGFAGAASRTGQVRESNAQRAWVRNTWWNSSRPMLSAAAPIPAGDQPGRGRDQGRSAAWDHARHVAHRPTPAGPRQTLGSFKAGARWWRSSGPVAGHALRPLGVTGVEGSGGSCAVTPAISRLGEASPFLRQDLSLLRKVPALLVTGHTGSAAGDTEEAAGKQDTERGNGSLWNLLVVSPDVLVGPRMPNHPLNTGQLSCPLSTACLWQEWANRGHLWRNLLVCISPHGTCTGLCGPESGIRTKEG